MGQSLDWIFIDFDGTLVDSVPIMIEIYFDFLQQFNIKGSLHEFDEMNGLSLLEIVNVFKERYKLKESHEDLCQLYQNEFIQAYKTKVKPKMFAREMMSEFVQRGFRLILTTSASQAVAFEFIKQQQWETFFNHYVFGDEVQKSKPDPEIYGLALKKANTQAGKVIAIEDSMNGVKSAKGQDIFVIAVAGHHSKPQLMYAGANQVVTNLNEVMSVLESSHVL